MLIRRPRLGALLCLLLWTNIVAAGLIDPLMLRRADASTTTTAAAAAKSDNTPTKATSTSPVPTKKNDASTTTAADAKSTTTTDKNEDASTTNTKDGNASEKTTATTTTSATTRRSTGTQTTETHSSAVASSALPSGSVDANTTDPFNQTLYNSTIPHGELPLKPKLTPGWGVAGIILILTGVVYTLIGIKKRFLHTFFSTGYLASLGTTVLIIYVMSLPVHDGVQGGFVVAVVCTGCILGGVAIIFKDITEGLGCLLGGFCFGMWLMCLKEGGLLHNTDGRIIFIVAFTAGGFAFYLVRWTREYALLIAIAFAGATVTVLGIDAFSRAGLKEFWAYIWNLNNNLFPLGATTYPVTRGIRVELAVTVILFLAGIISQLKLWRVVQERRAKRAAELEEEERRLAKEEECIGRQIEERNARDRQEWEAVYGDGTAPPPRTSENDSGVGDMDSEKRLTNSQVTAVSSKSPVLEGEGSETIELAEMPANGEEQAPPMRPVPKAAAEAVLAHDDKDGMVTVRVAQDDYPNGPPEDMADNDNGNGNHTNRLSRDGMVSNAPVPGIVPLPFRVPEDEDDDDRSSAATFADEDDRPRTGHSRSSRHFAKRLSQGSADIFRSLSQKSKRASAVLEGGANSPMGESSEGLVTPRSVRFAPGSGRRKVVDRDGDDSDNDSLAVTVDGMSSDGDSRSMRDFDDAQEEPSREIEINAELAEGEGKEEAKDGEESEKTGKVAAAAAAATAGVAAAAAVVKSKKEGRRLSVPSKKASEKRPISTETVSTEILDVPSSRGTPTPSGERSPSRAADSEATGDKTETGSRHEKSVAASVDSTPASLTRDRLPRSLSRVAMSYRTNEWAKHLSNAEMPEPDMLHIDEVLPDSPSLDGHYEELHNQDDEAPAPLNLTALQQTAANGAPPPAAPRSFSMPMPVVNQTMPGTATPGTLSRSNSRQSITVQDVAPAAAARNTYMNSNNNGYRSMSANHIGRRGSLMRTSTIVEESDDMEEVDLQQPQTQQPQSLQQQQQQQQPQSPLPDEAGLSQIPESTEEGRSSAPTPSPPLNNGAIPGVVSFSSPQTLIGQREMLLRSKSSGSYIGGSMVHSESMNSLNGNMSHNHMMTSGMTPMPILATAPAAGPGSDSGSLYNFHPGAVHPGAAPIDLDDLPMSQRRNLMRQTSAMSLGLPALSSIDSRPGSVTPGAPLPGSATMPSMAVSSVPAPTAGTVSFDSHQPKRGLAHLPTASARQAQMANFRNSVAAELRAGVPVVPLGGNKQQQPGLRESVSSPYLHGAMAGMSAISLNGAASSTPSPYSGGRESEVKQNIEMQRTMMMNQKEAEAHRREMQRLDKERNERAFEERMRRGELMDAHREAMRRMQASAK